MESKYNVFLTKELTDADVEALLFGRSIDKFTYTLRGYRQREGINNTYYLEKDENACVEGMIAYVAFEQLWLLDQWNDFPLLRRISITTDLSGKDISLYIYVNNSMGTNNINSNSKERALAKAKLLREKLDSNTMGLCDLHLMYPCSFHEYIYSQCSGDDYVYAGEVSENPYYEKTPEEQSQYEL